MRRYVSLLRGINVSGQKKIKMVELKGLYEKLGFKNVRSYIQSGNVIFDTAERNAATLRKKIESALKEHFGFEVLVLLRTKTAFQKTAERNPFSGKDERLLHITFLFDILRSAPMNALNSAKAAGEEILLRGQELYLYCPHSCGKNKLSNNLIENKLKTAATTRNRKTVNALNKLLD